MKWQGSILTVNDQAAVDLDIKLSINTNPSCLFCMPLVLQIDDRKTCTAAYFLLRSFSWRNRIYKRNGCCNLVTDVQGVLNEGSMTNLALTQYVMFCGEGTYTILPVEIVGIPHLGRGE